MWRRWWEYWRRRHRQPRHHSGQLYHYRNGYLWIDHGYGHCRPHRAVAAPCRFDKNLWFQPGEAK